MVAVAHDRDLDDEPDEQGGSDRDRQQGRERVPAPGEDRLLLHDGHRRLMHHLHLRTDLANQKPNQESRSRDRFE